MSGEASVYRRDDEQVYVASYSRVVNGPYIVNGWARGLSRNPHDDELGKTVLQALDRTELDIPEVAPEEPQRRQRPMFKLAGVTSQTRFVAGTRMVGVDRDIAGVLTVRPTRNEGGRRGFFFLTSDHDVVLHPSYSDEAVGRAVREGLDRALVKHR